MTELTDEHLLTVIEQLDKLVERLPFVVHPDILKEMKRFGLCTDGWVVDRGYLSEATE